MQSLLKQIRQYAEENGVPIVLPGGEEVLRSILAETQPQSILEIGTAIGFSGIVMLDACKNATLNTIEMDEERLSHARENFALAGVKDRVTIFNADAREIMPSLSGTYDFVFMDGPKGQYLDFLPYVKDLLKVGGTLVCDNVLFHGLVKSAITRKHRAYTLVKNLKLFLKKLQEDGDFDTQLLEIGDGMTVSKRLK